MVIVEPSSDVRVSGSRGEEPDSDCSLTDAYGDDEAIGSVPVVAEGVVLRHVFSYR